MLIKNIKSLLQTSASEKALRGKHMSELKSIQNAWLLIENDTIKNFGSMNSCPKYDGDIIDGSGRMVLPTWCDSHTHLVFATSREEEFEMRLKGKSYQEIAEAGGGILNSAKKIGRASCRERV